MKADQEGVGGRLFKHVLLCLHPVDVLETPGDRRRCENVETCRRHPRSDEEESPSEIHPKETGTERGKYKEEKGAETPGGDVRRHMETPEEHRLHPQ